MNEMSRDAFQRRVAAAIETAAIETPESGGTVIELDRHGADETTAAMVRLMVNDKEYMLIGGNGSVTVLVGRWINDRRALGRTFWSEAALRENYKRDGAVLVEYARQLTALKA